MVSFTFFKGPPVFVEENKLIQFGKLGKHTKLKVVVNTVSSIECCHIEGENRRKIQTDMEIILKNTTHLFNGTNITIEEQEITFSFTSLQRNDYQKYKITLCNLYGNSTCIIELKPITTGRYYSICMLLFFMRNLICSKSCYTAFSIKSISFRVSFLLLLKYILNNLSES